MQATLFREALHLHRRIEADLSGNTVRLRDRVHNAGYPVTPHMFMYHINLDYPLLDEGAEVRAPIRGVIKATHAGAQNTGYRTCPSPRPGCSEQVWQHDIATDANGRAPMALLNDRPGLEPATHHMPGNQFARDRDEMIWLNPGEDRRYDAAHRAGRGRGSGRVSPAHCRNRAATEDRVSDPLKGVSRVA